MTNAANNRLTDDISKDLLFDEIRYIVAKAIGQRATVRVRPHATRLLKTYPSAGLSEVELRMRSS